MTHLARPSIRALLGATALVLATTAMPGFADSIFTPSADGFTGRMMAGAAERGAPVYPGSTVTIAGQGLVPGQQITLMRGGTVLNPEGPLVADAEGKVSFSMPVDEAAATGLQPIVVIAENPAAATVVDLKISPEIPLSGAEGFDITSEAVTAGLYQVIYSAASDAIFVTSAVGRPPVKQSELVRIAPDTLEIVARATPGAAPARADGSDGGLFAVYGVDVDDAHGRVWVTNTRQDTVAVYAAEDLALVRQFEAGTVNHARDVVVDESRGRAYASATGTGVIKVFDTATLEEQPPIEIASQIRGEEFSVMSLDLDAESGTLVTVSMSTPEAAVIDLDSGTARVIPLPGAKAASGVAYDPQDGLIFVASQATDNLLIVKADSGEVLHDVEVGAGALNVAFEPEGRLAYVANRGAGTITVVDTAGRIVANLDAGSYPNQLRADGKGNVWAVNKSRGENDESGDRIWRITPGQ